MSIPERVLDAERVVLVVLLHIMTVLMNVLYVSIGWVIGVSLTNFVVDVFFTENVLLSGLARVVCVLCVDSPTEDRLLLFTILLLLLFQNTQSPNPFDGYTDTRLQMN